MKPINTSWEDVTLTCPLCSYCFHLNELPRNGTTTLNNDVINSLLSEQKKAMVEACKDMQVPVPSVDGYQTLLETNPAAESAFWQKVAAKTSRNETIKEFINLIQKGI